MRKNFCHILKKTKRLLVQKLREGKYKPNPVRRVVDPVFQQATAQVLSPVFEKQFSDNSYAFRANRGAQDAPKSCQKYVDDGYVYVVVDMDLEKFFDTVRRSKLIEIL